MHEALVISIKMVRFSCFNAHTHSDKPKKTVHLSVEVQKTLADRSQNQALKDFRDSSGLNSLHLKVQQDAIPNNSSNHVMASSSTERGWKSEEFNSSYDIESDRRIYHSGRIKKSLSLGCGLDREGRASVGNDSEDETDIGYSCDRPHNQDRMVAPVGGKDPEISSANLYQEAPHYDSLQASTDLVNTDSIFSIGDTLQSEKEGNENSDTHFSGECADESSDHTPRTPPIVVKSNSMPNIGSSGERSDLKYLEPHSKSCEDLTVLELRWKEMVIHEVGTGVIHDRERNDTALNNGKSNCENNAGEGFDPCNYVGSSKDWIIPVMDEANAEKHLHGESSARQREGFPSNDFKIKRIEDWVIDLQHCGPLEESNDGLSNVDDHQVQRAARFDAKVTPGMEAAKKYISSLTATSTTAQLANHGLAVIPFLSAFVSLKALNLSGNNIVRIAAGALPRGLHSLNLSKNSISTIEGLRELTRLRVLDLSYNRIVRIGHGLASCSSLKELYLAGNKISEVEGLHRLLKLNVLDLRFNKISTAKCLGQLAANYNSLQAISLEGNPAQKNVGDEQLKKYLQGLLPHLAYFNRQSIKAGTLKDAADRPARLGITADRGLRLEHKSSRKGNHGTSVHKTSFSSSIHGQKGQATVSPKPSRVGRPGRLPPTGTKTGTSHRNNFYDFGSKLLNFRHDLAMRRSRSEGTLAAAL